MSHNPTPEQLDIIEAIKAGKSLIVEAGAGTGKTSTIEMFAPHVEGNPLAMSFNKKITEELKKRLPQNWTVMTANGLGHRAWGRAVNKRLVVEAYKVSDITKQILKDRKDIEWEEKVELSYAINRLVAQAKHKGIIPEQAQKPYKGLFPDTYDEWEALADDHFIDFNEEILAYARQVLTESIRQAYEGLIDFDDQIYMSVLFGAPYQQVDRVVVDEYQDLSPINQRQIEKLRPRQLIAVGDPRQSIYAFRGADSSAMRSTPERFKNLTFTTLPLSVTFRCPKAVVERQKQHYPEYTAAAGNPEGEIRTLTKWSHTDIPAGTAILCRNNAPLIDLAFKLLRSKVGINFLGKDIGRNIKALLKKACGKENMLSDKAIEFVERWQYEELNKPGKRPEKSASVLDRAESMRAILENSSDLLGAFALIDEIMLSEGNIVLATAHKAKGLEWQTVVHLDPWRVPSKWAKKAQQEGNYGPMQQEKNLRYVLETRAQQTLIFANLDQYGVP